MPPFRDRVAARARQIIAEGRLAAGRTDPCVCGAAKAAHTGAKNTGGHAATGCGRYRYDTAFRLAARALDADRTHPLDDIDTYLTRLFPRPVPEAGGWGVGPSDYLRCRRQIQYRENPPDDLVLDEVDMSAARFGSIMHEMTRRARRELYDWRLFEIPVVLPGLDRAGRVDEYDPLLAKVKDLKFPGENRWDAYGIDGPEPAHEGQVDIYGYGLAEAGHPVDWVELEYVNRVSGDWEPFPRAFDKDRAETALHWLHSVDVGLDMGVEMPRDRSGPSSDKICEKYCPFVSKCWNVAEAEAAGRSPESFTILRETPDAAKIEWAARRAWDTKQDHADTKAGYEQARYLLRGIPSGTYGDFVVTEKSRRVKDWKAWAEKVQRRIDDGATVEQVKLIEVPTRTDRWTEVKPVRAHVRAEADAAAVEAGEAVAAADVAGLPVVDARGAA